MAERPDDPRVTTVMSALTTVGSLLTEDERADLASRVLQALDDRHPPDREGWSEKVGCAVGAFCAIALMLMVVAAAGIGLVWLAQKVL